VERLQAKALTVDKPAGGLPREWQKNRFAGRNSSAIGAFEDAHLGGVGAGKSPDSLLK
jgi:hypothetical protein